MSTNNDEIRNEELIDNLLDKSKRKAPEKLKDSISEMALKHIPNENVIPIKPNKKPKAFTWRIPASLVAGLMIGLYISDFINIDNKQQSELTFAGNDHNLQEVVNIYNLQDADEKTWLYEIKNLIESNNIEEARMLIQAYNNRFLKDSPQQ